MKSTVKKTTRKTKARKQAFNYKRELWDYLVENDKPIVETMIQELGIKSIVIDDPEYFPNSTARYNFIGGGCGFAWLKYDKRSKKAVAVEDAYYEIKEKFRNHLIKKYIPKAKQKELEAMGCPIQAIMYQSMAINNTILWRVVDFMRLLDVKNATVYSRYD